MAQQGMPRGGRSRIVIDVAQAQAAARARRRGGRGKRILKLGALVLLALVTVAAAAGYAWWRSFRRAPSYSLALLLDAARREDLAEVERLTDPESVAQGFVPQVVEKLAGGGVALPPGLQGQLSAALPQLIPRVRETMSAEIARDLKTYASGAAGDTPTPLVALAVSRLARVEERGDAARVTLERGGQATELTMRRDGERWRVTNIKDDRLAAEIAARLAASLPQTAIPPPGQPRRRPGR